MSDQFKWDGNVLRGPFKQFVGVELELPRGPPESAPFNSGKWWIHMRKKGDGWQLNKRWSCEVVRARDLNLAWKVRNPADADNPSPINYSAGLGDVMIQLHSEQGANIDPQGWNCDEHVIADSEFEMTVECPSLFTQAGSSSIPRIASYIFGKCFVLNLPQLHTWIALTRTCCRPNEVAVFGRRALCLPRLRPITMG
jgi:hypothetical protein